VSKLQRHRCPTFGALRFRTQRAFSHLTNGPYTPAPSVGSPSSPCFLLYTWRPLTQPFTDVPVQPSYQWTVHARAICRQSEHALLSSVHMASSRGRTGNSLLCGSVKACFYIYIYNKYIKVTSKHARIRLLRCVQIATPSVPYFLSFTISNKPRSNRQLHFYIYIYIYIYIYATRFLTPKVEQKLQVFEDKYSNSTRL
jgi:hypothetical protein